RAMGAIGAFAAAPPGLLVLYQAFVFSDQGLRWKGGLADRQFRGYSSTLMRGTRAPINLAPSKMRTGSRGPLPRKCSLSGLPRFFKKSMWTRPKRMPLGDW